VRPFDINPQDPEHMALQARRPITFICKACGNRSVEVISSPYGRPNGPDECLVLCAQCGQLARQI
jgi:uncharacterized Zn finger protein